MQRVEKQRGEKGNSHIKTWDRSEDIKDLFYLLQIFFNKSSAIGIQPACKIPCILKPLPALQLFKHVCINLLLLPNVTFLFFLFLSLSLKPGPILLLCILAKVCFSASLMPLYTVIATNMFLCKRQKCTGRLETEKCLESFKSLTSPISVHYCKSYEKLYYYFAFSAWGCQNIFTWLTGFLACSESSFHFPLWLLMYHCTTVAFFIRVEISLRNFAWI